MAVERNLTIKKSFQHELRALDNKDAVDIQEKLSLLLDDPTHAPPVKKRLSHANNLYRLRHKHYRIFYTFDDHFVSVLALRKRDKAYDSELPDAEGLGGPEEDALDLELLVGKPNKPKSVGEWVEQPLPKAAQGTQLREPITVALLRLLKVDAKHHKALTACKTEEDLLDCNSVPDDVRLQVFDALVGRPLEQVLAQPDLVVNKPEDLLRYKEGELLGFLLKLSPEQEKLVGWAIKASGPTLLKGGPGTGKSTVAMYRARVFLEALRKQGTPQPRILFTTYTNALVRFSEQLLAALLGADAKCVEVMTADKLARELCREALKRNPDIASDDDLKDALEFAVAQAKFTGNSLVQAAQRQALARMRPQYLQEELLGVIQARAIPSLSGYLEAPRPGRELPLNKTQREAVWRVYEAFTAFLAKRNKLTWQMVRATAADAVETGKVSAKYDAVIVDEAQDLDAVALRMLTGLCVEPGKLFLTADANQSIYGASFRWSDVHERLKFTGRTGVLRANHRSTREIGEAAQSYLAAGALDQDETDRQYEHTGPLPAVRAVASPSDELKLLERFIQGASRELRLGLSACAVLCPTKAAAKRISAELVSRGVAASYVEPKELDLKANGVKVLTLKSAKGLEFPIVALAGFTDGGFPYVPPGATEEERAEVYRRERRTMFVAATRAMRALLIVVPAGTENELLCGFEPSRWNLGESK